MQKYDIIVFENYRQAQHHKIDVMLIAHLLHHSGMSVALLDIYHEEKKDEIEGIPVIHHNIRIPDILKDLRPRKLLNRIIYRLSYFRHQYKFMAAVRDEVKDLADSFYCGSYHVNMQSAWFEINKPCYWWGLRSNRFVFAKNHYDADKLSCFRIHYLKSKFLRNPYQMLFVSNEIIKNEFIKLGLSKDRIIIREERVVDKLGDSRLEELSPVFSFLTIGQLRPQKRVEKSIHAFLSLNNPDIKFLIVGKSENEYESILKKAIGKSGQIERVGGFLEYGSFLLFFRQCHFVVFADEPIQGTVTNGTMLEALINYRPIIAPNYDPYKYYIEKYHIGILYNPSIEGDLSRAMQEALSKGAVFFVKSINDFLQTILFDRVSRQLSEQLMKRQLHS